MFIDKSNLLIDGDSLYKALFKGFNLNDNIEILCSIDGFKNKKDESVYKWIKILIDDCVKKINENNLKSLSNSDD